MKKFAIASAALFFAAMTTSAFASCDTRKSDEDAQAMCASKCEDAYLKDQQGWTADMSAVKANKVACDAKFVDAEVTTTRTIPPRVRTIVLDRDRVVGARCRVAA